MLKRYLPILTWLPGYTRNDLTNDAIAAAVVTIMLIPQGMAYAMLAGLPPQAGLYAAILPLLLYAVFGTSRPLAVGPVAVVALMTAASAGAVAQAGSAEFHYAALWLALISGGLMLAMGLFRLGFIANFLSHPVISGFITAAGILIAASQLRHLLGAPIGGKTLPDLVPSLVANITSITPATVLLSAALLAFLFWSRKGAAPLLQRFGISAPVAKLLAKTALLVAVVISTLLAWGLGLERFGVAILGEIPRGLPEFGLPPVDTGLIQMLFVPAIMIAIVGYVESISIAQTLAAKKRQSVNPDNELIALGLANLGAGLSNAMPVTGGLSRTIVNYDAGVSTPAAGAMTALSIGAAIMVLTPLMYFLPRATLAAIIIVAVLSLLDFRALPRTWAYSRADGAAMAATMLFTLMMGVEMGLLAGVGLSLGLFLFRTSRPHMAVVGQVAGTEHFRNVERHEVTTDPAVFAIRVDESLYFPNARALEDRIVQALSEHPDLRHVVLQCTAVNYIDASALESLEAINTRLKDGGVTFHLSEVKGPVMDQLSRAHLLQDLTGEVFLTQFDAMAKLSPDLTRDCLGQDRCDTLLRSA
ncbi:putative sulfate transporter [Roseibaca ekhonensis]|jgi:SulP family sulfate permease|uniref:Putative sulfate transporter n=1 Tax=Roseinatronobacter ekhonensis TaxID=254356 RepID=A0A3B0MZ96_9RHOB|nr:sulfate permease [Roseibaca ekhonensis]SUZ33116.1 putative sulfate transporter [Roseibaca ekhonensis]